MAEMVEEEPGLWERLRARFRGEEEETAPRYERKLLDGRMERFLDENFNNYVEEYNLVTELDLRAYEERYQEITGRVKSLIDFTHDIDAEVASLEKRLKAVKSASKSTGARKTKKK